MSALIPRIRKLAAVFAVVIVSAAGTATAAPVTAAAGSIPRVSTAQWQQTMQWLRAPGRGCFTASYPAPRWHKTRCKAAPQVAYSPAPERRAHASAQETAEMVGDHLDYAAEPADGQPLSKVTGTIDSITPAGTTEADSSLSPAGNMFSLQLNTNYFQTAKCGSAGSGCKGWVQFVYNSHLNAVFIQYWLVNYGASCTALGWMTGGGGDCFINSKFYQPPHPLTVQDLPGATLTGTTSPGCDQATLTWPPSGVAATMCEPDPLGLDGQWNQAEWGVFGASGDSEADFTPPPPPNPQQVTVVARTTFGSGTMHPLCVDGGSATGLTGETNNLFLPEGPVLERDSSGHPTLISTQTSTSPPGPPGCQNAITHGEPHLITSGNLAYDFQATGDFELATSGPRFLVQNRQVALPSPHQFLAVNQAVAARIGSSDVAVCTAPTRLLINNQPVQLASGGHTSLPGGGEVSLSGTTYLIQDAAMDSVEAAVITGNPDRINVTINLPHRPATFHGLLASAPTNPDAIQARNGTVLTPPFNFHQFYNVYGNSWRVPLSQSLLTACGKPPASTNPSNVYYAGNLPPKLAAVARAECLAAGVPHIPPLLDACTLDVAILGKNAAQDYLDLPTNLTWGKINPP